MHAHLGIQCHVVMSCCDVMLWLTGDSDVDHWHRFERNVQLRRTSSLAGDAHAHACANARAHAKSSVYP